jgi:Tfp pilus assembly protein PilV
MSKTRRQSGDTLVEVTIALALLASILVTSFVLATRAYRSTLDARERVQAVNLLQEQAEAIHYLRDNNNNPWLNPASGFYAQIAAAGGSIPTSGASNAFHVFKDPSKSGNWTLKNGACDPATAGAGDPCANLPFTLAIYARDSSATLGPATNTKIEFHFTAQWTSVASAGVMNTTELYTDLVNLDAYRSLP